MKPRPKFIHFLNRLFFLAYEYALADGDPPQYYDSDLFNLYRRIR